MQNSSDLDMSEYYRINDKISDTSSYSDICRTILTPLSRLIGAETSIFGILKKDEYGIHGHNFISNNVNNKEKLIYEENFQNDDPVLPYAYNSAKKNYNLGLAKSFTFALDNIIDITQFTRGEYYNEFLRPNSIRQILATGIPSGTDSSLVYVLGFHRSCNTPFKKSDAQISSYFGPVLFNALNNLELKSQLCDHSIIVSSYHILKNRFPIRDLSSQIIIIMLFLPTMRDKDIFIFHRLKPTNIRALTVALSLH